MTSSPSSNHRSGDAPPLPPRPSSHANSTYTDPSLTAMASCDPRSSSTQSLAPNPEDESGRRRLLLVYIHGFLGDETSFRNFPAHVHNLVTITLAESHVVHTKIYPKYRSRYALDVARDDFSKWLTPHEDQFTDVILLAHSMGGLIAADIALLYRHRIIGTINFDVPFLGMHPGIVKAGLGSIFKPWPTPEEDSGVEADPASTKPSRMNTLFNLKPSDPNFNPSFHNDVHLPVRKGWENTLHWLNKHSNGLIKGTKGLVQSHIEFGGAMADYRTLRTRYARIRALEEDDEGKRKSANPEQSSPQRIRFVNYYTVSTGRPKKPKSPKSSPSSQPASRGLQHQDNNTTGLTSASQLTLDTNPPRSSMDAPSISVEQHLGGQVVLATPHVPLSATTNFPFQSSSVEAGDRPELPEIPPAPQEPPFVDLAEYADKDQRKAAEREWGQALEEYQQAIKVRNNVIKERARIEEEWMRQREKEQEREQPAAAKADSGHESDALNKDFGEMQLGVTGHSRRLQENSPYGNYEFSRSTIMNQPMPDEQASYTSASNPPSSYTESTHSLATMNTTASVPDAEAPPKKKRLKKFCMLPPKDARGHKDPTWIQVYMEGVDEVIAHTTLFFMDEVYERLVGDVGARIEDWIKEADSLRVARELEGLA